MAAQPNDLDSANAAELALLGDVTVGVDFLIDRGALSRARPYAGVTRASGGRLLLIARAQGVRAPENNHFVETHAELSAVPATLKGVVHALRGILESNVAYRSAIFAPAPHLSAFAVANRELPIVYGSGLLRRTPRPIAIVPWERDVNAASVLQLVSAHPENSAVLLAHRGVIAYSDEPFSKLAKFVVSLEESAQLTLNAQLLGGARALPPGAFEQMQQGIAGD